jgi:hypothetical protein
MAFQALSMCLVFRGLGDGTENCAMSALAASPGNLGRGSPAGLVEVLGVKKQRTIMKRVALSTLSRGSS